MNYKQHIIAGLLFSATAMFLVVRYLGVNPAPFDYLIMSVICICYSILPDIDTPASKARQGVTIGLVILSLYFLSQSKIVLTAISLLTLLFIWTMDMILDIKHRGIFHTTHVGFVLSVPLMFISIPVFIVAFVSYFSHLCMDGMAKSKKEA